MAVYFFVVLPPRQRRGVLLGQQQLSQNAVGDEHAFGGQVPAGVLLLGKAHIGEVQSSLWDAETVAVCEAAGVRLL